MLHGISCRDYERAAAAIPEAIGLSKSQVSKEFIKVSAEKLKEFEGRDVSKLDIVAVFLDGKTFSDDTMVIALAVTLDGAKIPIGFVQTETENDKAIGEFLSTLVRRGLKMDDGLLFVIDGSKGMESAIKKVFKKRAVIQRCQWHKRENVLSYLPKERHGYYRRKLRDAYHKHPGYDEAKVALMKIHAQLLYENQSAANSLAEGLEETLTLHCLGVFHLVGNSLKTTNGIENMNSLIEQRCGRVDYWKNSSQTHRWLVCALLDAEPRMNRLRGATHLPQLREALKKHLKLEHQQPLEKAA